MTLSAAVCLVGRIRGYTSNFENFRERMSDLARTHDIHFFVSLNAERDDYHIEFEECLRGIGKNVRIHYSLYTDPIFPEKLGMCSMFYNQQRCGEMIRESNVQFDVVIKYRTEIHSGTPFEIKYPLQPNTVYVPEGFDYGGLNDQMAYGDAESMHVYSELYNSLKDYNDAKVYIHPETLLKYHMQSRNINVIRFRYPYHFVR